MTNHAAQVPVDVPLVYIESTIPAGMTIADYRRSRPQRPRLVRRVRSWHWGRGSGPATRSATAALLTAP
jgi:hypothetical protein